MRLEYQLTPDDLREAFAPPVQRRDAIWTNVVCYAVLLALAVPTAAGWMGQEAPADTAAALAAPPQNLWVTLAPSLVGFTLVAGGTLLGRWQDRRGRARLVGAATPPAARVQGTVLVAVAFAWMVLPNVPALAVAWHPTLRRVLWAAVAPWFAYMVYASAVVLTRPRHTAAVVAALTRSLRRPATVDVSDDGITSTDGVVDARYRWPHLVRYRETAHLLVLLTEDGGPLILPKRALTGPAGEDQLRALLQTHVASGTFLPSGAAFPVVPVPAVELGGR